MTEQKRPPFDFRLIVGLVVIAIGAMLLLERMDIGLNISLHTYWPSLLILVGIAKVFSHRHNNDVFTGGIFVVVGTLFQLNNLHIINFWWGDLWPLAIILGGVIIIKHAMFPGKGRCNTRVFTYTNGTGAEEHCFDKMGKGSVGRRHDCFSGTKQVIQDDYLDSSALFGGGEYKITSKNFKGGSANAVFGGIEIDMRDAEMEGDRIELIASALFGAVEMRVPTHWEVVMNGTPILGALENKAFVSQEPTKKLVIKGSAVFGAVEVKN